MVRNAFVIALVPVLLAGAARAGAESHSFHLSAVVPVVCKVSHERGAVGGPADGAVNLGNLTEYCNAPGGYELIVTYAPGTLQGTVLTAGEDRVVLNGSGEATLSRVPGPRVRTRSLIGVPGAHGFDSANLQVQVRPA